MEPARKHKLHLSINTAITVALIGFAGTVWNNNTSAKVREATQELKIKTLEKQVEMLQQQALQTRHTRKNIENYIENNKK